MGFKVTQEKQPYMEIKEAADLLSVSQATLRNWIKTGKIYGIRVDDKVLVNHLQIMELKAEIESGTSQRLKSRRNKKAISGRFVPQGYVDSQAYLEFAEHLMQIISQSKARIDPSLVLLEVCLKLLVILGRIDNPMVSERASLTELVLNQVIDTGYYSNPLQELCSVKHLNGEEKEILRSIYSLQVEFCPGEDLLGLVYMSLSEMNVRKTQGSYYTPTKIVNSLVKRSLELLLKEERTGEREGEHGVLRVLDPCCGSGNFLIKLFLELKTKLMTLGISTSEAEALLMKDCLIGYDVDKTAVALAKINLLLLCETKGVHSPTIINQNTIQDYNPKSYLKGLKNYDLIIGNPPWGYAFCQEEIYQYRKNYEVARTGVESFSLFVEYGIRHLKKDGILGYILPEALLNVSSHRGVRQLLLEETSLREIDLLGSQFSHVVTPAILLLTQKKLASPTQQTIIRSNDTCHTMPQAQFKENDKMIFNTKASFEENKILKHMKSLAGVMVLKDQAEFALGIVTGNNKDFVLSAPPENGELILKGNDLFKYNVYPGQSYFIFEPDKYQQVAPEHFYRAPEKLFYRFINENLVFAYDSQGLLSLNSANILIPKLPGYSIKYVLAILNSRPAQFFHSYSFLSVKVLRRHLEALPIPSCTKKDQFEIIKLVDQVLVCKEPSKRLEIYDQIDERVMDLYNFSTEQKGLILSKFQKVKFLSKD